MRITNNQLVNSIGPLTRLAETKFASMRATYAIGRALRLCREAAKDYQEGLQSAIEQNCARHEDGSPIYLKREVKEVDGKPVMQEIELPPGSPPTELYRVKDQEGLQKQVNELNALEIGIDVAPISPEDIMQTVGENRVSGADLAVLGWLIVDSQDVKAEPAADVPAATKE